MTDRIESPPAGEIQGLVERAMALANAATGSRWGVDGYSPKDGRWRIFAEDVDREPMFFICSMDHSVLSEAQLAQSNGNAAFIAASRQLIPELCEAITRLSRPAEEIREAAAKIAEDVWDHNLAGAHGGEQANRTARAIRAMPLPLSSGSNKSDDGKKGQTG